MFFSLWNEQILKVENLSQKDKIMYESMGATVEKDALYQM